MRRGECNGRHVADICNEHPRIVRVGHCNSGKSRLHSSSNEKKIIELLTTFSRTRSF